MFGQSYQGGQSVKVFSPVGKDPVANWKLSNKKHVRKVYEKEVKGFVYECVGSTQGKMALPSNARDSLGLVQPYLVLQLKLSPAQPFSLEICINGEKKSKRRSRILMSTNFKELSITPLHMQLPLCAVKRGVWLNLCIDLESMALGMSGSPFRSIEALEIRAFCKIRQIFTVRTPPSDDTDDAELLQWTPPLQTAIISRVHEFPVGLQYKTQLLTLKKVELSQKALVKLGKGRGSRTSSASRSRQGTSRQLTRQGSDSKMRRSRVGTAAARKSPVSRGVERSAFSRLGTDMTQSPQSLFGSPPQSRMDTRSPPSRADTRSPPSRADTRSPPNRLDTAQSNRAGSVSPGLKGFSPPSRFGTSPSSRIGQSTSQGRRSANYFLENNIPSRVASRASMRRGRGSGSGSSPTSRRNVRVPSSVGKRRGGLTSADGSASNLSVTPSGTESQPRTRRAFVPRERWTKDRKQNPRRQGAQLTTEANKKCSAEKEENPNLGSIPGKDTNKKGKVIREKNEQSTRSEDLAVWDVLEEVEEDIPESRPTTAFEELGAVLNLELESAPATRREKKSPVSEVQQDTARRDSEYESKKYEDGVLHDLWSEESNLSVSQAKSQSKDVGSEITRNRQENMPRFSDMALGGGGIAKDSEDDVAPRPDTATTFTSALRPIRFDDARLMTPPLALGGIFPSREANYIDGRQSPSRLSTFLDERHSPSVDPGFPEKENGLGCSIRGGSTGDRDVELMYDPVLECYYEPKTNKYFQFKT